MSEPAPMNVNEAASPRWPLFREPTAHDWPEDWPHENGQYFGDCHGCKTRFIGHKRRIYCKSCDAGFRADYEAMKEEEKQEWQAQRMADLAAVWPSIINREP